MALRSAVDVGVTSCKIGTADIETSTILAANLADNCITSAKIASGVVIAADIASSTITGGKLVTGTIAAAQIANSTVTGAKIATSTITVTKLATSMITGTKIADSAITSAKIAASTITGGDIATSTITVSKIATSTLTGSKLADATVTNAKLAGSITSDKLSKPYARHYVPYTRTLASYASGPGYYLFQVDGACTLTEFGAALGATQASGSTVLDLHAGLTVATLTTVLTTAKLVCSQVAYKPVVVTPSHTALADNSILRIDVDSFGSGGGTAVPLHVWVTIKQLLSA